MAQLVETFGDRLRKLRQDKGLLQSELGAQIGVTKNHISRYERGYASPNLDNLERLARALSVTLDFLVYGETIESMAARKLHPNTELLDLFLRCNQLPEESQDVIKRITSTYIKLDDLSQALKSER